MWQAKEVEQKLQNLGYETVLVPVLSSGDKNLNQPLYSLGITGVFTKDLDIALLNNEIDIAVHSLKDVPTILPQNIEVSAVLERDFPQDVLVRKSSSKNKDLAELKIATSSLRRRAFWSEKFPNTQFSDIRGNVQTRLKKLEEGDFDATLFSLAGIKRMEMELEYEMLDFMISAPSQGVVAISSRVDDVETKAILQKINHKTTQICVEIERNFLRTLEGGCTAPIGAIAVFEENKIKFSGRLNSLDGSKTINVVEEFEYDDSENYGKKFAEFVLKNGGKEMMEEIKKQIKE
ncbi:porphobilinogen deaminase [Cloacibacterium normanense]|uniref:Hydroxymethylbilane synthase n=2 Tax=Cloacibacterium normanense TaxID=237258 RepID=A0A1E5UG30_9FLAO|nr:porphobilinogen deaminase [Cloacibacterium normanense]